MLYLCTALLAPGYARAVSFSAFAFLPQRLQIILKQESYRLAVTLSFYIYHVLTIMTRADRSKPWQEKRAAHPSLSLFTGDSVDSDIDSSDNETEDVEALINHENNLHPAPRKYADGTVHLVDRQKEKWVK